MYTNLVPVLKRAEDLNMAIGSFNTHNLEMLPAILCAAKTQGVPIIVQTSVGTAEYVGHRNMVVVCREMSLQCGIDVVLHLDHAEKYEDIKKAIDCGFTSVMFDGSSLPFKENILKTQQVVSYAKQHDVSVEAELGTVGGTEDGIMVKKKDVYHTDPIQAVDFVRLTDIDALAVAIGTSHGQYKSKTVINFERLQEINEAVDIPLVIHGGTGVRDDDVKKVISLGVRKFNVGTELLVGWTKTSKDCFASTRENASLRNNVIPCLNVINEIVQKKISLFKNVDGE